MWNLPGAPGSAFLTLPFWNIHDLGVVRRVPYGKNSVLTEVWKMPSTTFLSGGSTITRAY